MSDVTRCRSCGGYGDVNACDSTGRRARCRECDGSGWSGGGETDELSRLRTRIADLEEAGRKLGALCWAWQAVPKHKLNYLLFQPSMSGACAVPEGERIRQARFEVDSHPTAAGFVKEASDGH